MKVTEDAEQIIIKKIYIRGLLEKFADKVIYDKTTVNFVG